MSFHGFANKASAIAFALLVSCPLISFSLPTRNVPEGSRRAVDQGRVDAATEMNLTLMLKMRDRAGFDKAVEELYDPASSKFHEWFTDKDFEKYAATPIEYETVKNELVEQGFSILSSDPRRLSLRVRGTAAMVEKAFQTELHTLTYKGRTFQAHVRDAQLSGAAADLVDGVSGLERYAVRPQLTTVRNPKTGKPAIKKPVNTKKNMSAFLASFTSTPLSVGTPQLFDGYYIAAYYDGTEYGSTGAYGGLTPAQLQAHYGVPFIQGGVKYNGAGQTIALVEGYGYPTAEADANTASLLFGLPVFNTRTFSVVYPEGKPLNPNAGILTGWDTEIALDIQSAHAIAPGATIMVVASSGQDNEDQINSLNYIVTKGLASTVSSSWENDGEIEAGTLEEQAFNMVLETGAAAGISFQFSSGDGGDDGFGTPVGSVEIPANSPYATAVGGTSILNNPYGTGQIVTGWGNDDVYLRQGGSYIEDPLEGYYNGGAGGGQSQYYAKPSWQSTLAGSWRQVPDVSALADPYTGFPIIVTVSGIQYGEIYGGTSLASPIFTATWAIADQYNGKALGQAAPAISKLKAGSILDVVPPPSSITQYNVTGILNDNGTVSTLSATQIYTEAEDFDDYPNDIPLYGQTDFISTLWPNAFAINNYDLALSFGTDSSLTTTIGWDNVTGWGEPNGLPFIQGVTGKTTGARLAKR